MKRKKLYILIFAPLLLVALCILFYEGKDILDRHYEKERIAETDRKVVQKLKKIRVAQKAYYAVNGSYTDSWSELISFLSEGNFPIVQTTETIIDVSGRDSSIIKIDTLSLVPVFDSLKAELQYDKRSELAALKYVPMADTTFTMYANEFGEGRSKFHVVEVADPLPYNPRRKEGGDLSPLKFGSRSAATTKGNWE